MKHTIKAFAVLALLAPGAAAQEALLPSASWGTGIGMSAWVFNRPVTQSGGGLRAATQVAVPFRMRSIFGRWTVDLSGAGAAGAALYESEGGDEEGEEMRVVSLYGPTDLKLRLTGPVVSESFVLTLGFNLPTGKVGLNSDETLALQVLGAPALRMPVGAFGMGAGATVGAIRTFEGDEWAVALGASMEQRTEYSPLIFALDTGKAETRVRPGAAMHFTLGLDRALGENRLSALLAADMFTTDRVQLLVPSGTESAKEFQLGPQVALMTELDLAASNWRQSVLSLGVRQRMEFKDSSRTRTAGSSGTYLDGGWEGVRGGPDGRGFLLGVDGRWQSGLKFTDAFIGAAVTSAGLTIGWETLRTSSSTRVALRGEYASFDTGKSKATGMGVTLSVSLGGRREAQ